MNPGILTAAVTTAALVLAGCGSDDPPGAGASPTVAMTATDYAFDLPAEIDAGLVTFEMPNDGDEMHHAQLLRVHPDGDLDAALAELEGEDLAAMLDHVSFAGGVGIVAPGATASATVDLAPGDYAFFCGIPGEDGVPHLAKGMVSTFTVTGEPDGVTPPDTVGEVTLTEFAFDLPEDIAGTVAVTNGGAQPHEMLLLQLGEGVSLEEGLASMDAPPGDGPPPAVPAGGLQVIMPGDTAYLDLGALAPGTYGLVCFVPDPGSGAPHIELGMVGQLQIQ